jgi:hypothetical protein
LFRQWKQVAPQQYKDATLLYFMMDFARDVSLAHSETALSPSVIMGLRLAYAYFIEGKYLVNFFEFLHKCIVKKSFTIPSVMEAICNDLQLTDLDKLFIVVHLDEAQFIFDSDHRYEWETNPKPKGLFKLLM